MREWLRHLRTPGWIVRHFGGELPLASERKMRRHLESCPGCRALYMVQLLAEAGGATARHRRLERAVFGVRQAPTPAPETSARGRLAWGVLTASAAIVLLLLLIPRGLPLFREKGAGGDPSKHVSVSVYARTVAGSLEPVGGSIRSGQPLAFAYTNLSPERFDRLLLFGVDERFTVYWFYPGWTDARLDPAAHPVEHGRSGVELPEEVMHPIEGSRLRIFALFTNRRDLRVSDVEHAVKRLQEQNRQIEEVETMPVPETGQHTLLLEVTP